jgi:hypothetical protein
VEVILPLFSGILHEFSRRRSSSLTFSKILFSKVYVPDATNESFELMVVLELCADVLMVVHKVIHGHLAIVGETFVGTVKICEKIEKFESCLLNGL